jgi:hypothetical protein
VARLWPEHARMPQIDLGTILAVFAGLGIAVAFAVLAGTVSARVFFDASRASDDDATSSPAVRTHPRV